MRAPRALRRIGLASVVALVATAAPAAAQISVDKTELVFRTVSGSRRTELITLRNQGTERVQATIRLEDWDRSKDGTNNWYAYGSKPGSCGHTLSVFPLTVALEPGAQQSIRLALDSTATVDHECWAGAIVETVQPRIVGGRNVAYMIRTATKIYVQPAALSLHGEVAAIRMLRSDSSSAPARDSLIEVEFENTGGKHVEATGELQIRRPDNSIAATVKLPVFYTLVGAKSTQRVAMPTLPPGRYVVLAVLDYSGDELAAGQIEYEVARDSH